MHLLINTSIYTLHLLIACVSFPFPAANIQLVAASAYFTEMEIDFYTLPIIAYSNLTEAEYWQDTSDS